MVWRKGIKAGRTDGKESYEERWTALFETHRRARSLFTATSHSRLRDASRAVETRGQSKPCLSQKLFVGAPLSAIETLAVISVILVAALSSRMSGLIRVPSRHLHNPPSLSLRRRPDICEVELRVGACVTSCAESLSQSLTGICLFAALSGSASHVNASQGFHEVTKGASQTRGLRRRSVCRKGRKAVIDMARPAGRDSQPPELSANH